VSVCGKEAFPSPAILSRGGRYGFSRRFEGSTSQNVRPCVPLHPVTISHYALRITRNSDRPRASNKTMVDTQLQDSRPSFKTRLAWSPPEDETCGTGKQTRAKPLDRKREDLSDSGLDLETKIFRPPVEGEVFSWQTLLIERLDPETVRGWTSIPRGRSKVDLSL
jgi:hypothetical protein